MARIKSKKYVGVYLNHLSNGDISYTVNYKDQHNKKVWVTVGKKSNGINEKYSHIKRAEYINKERKKKAVNGKDTLDTAIIKAIHLLGKKKGFSF